jgi:hypothetical protein
MASMLGLGSTLRPLAGRGAESKEEQEVGELFYLK